jgi:hypothetical protein
MEGTARGAATGAANATIGSNGAGGHNNAGDAAAAAAAATKKKRLCKIEGCQRVIKSQGLCQRHGASAKRCKVQGGFVFVFLLYSIQIGFAGSSMRIGHAFTHNHFFSQSAI